MAWKLRLNNRKISKTKPNNDNRPKAYLVDRLYLPEETVDIQKAEKHYDRRVYNQKGCDRCMVYKEGERYSEFCAPCDNYKGRFTTFESVNIYGNDYLAFPAGSPEKVAENLGLKLKQFNVVDNRCDAKVVNPLRFTKKLYTGKEIVNGYAMANQVGIVKDFSKFKRGLIDSPPRSGKTIIAAYIFVGAKRRTIYLVHEKQLALQFYRTLLNFTDLREQRIKTGKKIIGIIESEADWFEDWDCVICNYQKFITDSGIERVIKHLIGKFGQVIVDECHVSAARAFYKLLNRLDCKRKIGMSATLTRKDGMQFLMHQMLGKLAAKGIVEVRPACAKIIDTGITTTKKWHGKAGYTYANQWLAQHKERIKLIIKNVFADLRANEKHSIVIPVMFKGQAAKLCRMINAQGQYNNVHKGEKWPDVIAHPYFDQKGLNRSLVLDQVRRGEIRVLVAIRKMVKVGIDVPVWTHIFLCFPMNNEEDFFQMTQRVNTSYPGKPQSVVKIFVDRIGISLGCFKPTYYGGVVKQKYLISSEDKQIAETLMGLDKKGKPKENLEGW